MTALRAISLKSIVRCEAGPSAPEEMDTATMEKMSQLRALSFQRPGRCITSGQSAVFLAVRVLYRSGHGAVFSNITQRPL